MAEGTCRTERNAGPYVRLHVAYKGEKNMATPTKAPSIYQCENCCHSFTAAYTCPTDIFRHFWNALRDFHVNTPNCP